MHAPTSRPNNPNVRRSLFRGRRETALDALEMRVDLTQARLAQLERSTAIAALERRACQSRAAIVHCRRLDFEPELRELLELKICAMEEDLALLLDEDLPASVEFFRTIGG